MCDWSLSYNAKENFDFSEYTFKAYVISLTLSTANCFSEPSFGKPSSFRNVAVGPLEGIAGGVAKGRGRRGSEVLISPFVL